MVISRPEIHTIFTDVDGTLTDSSVSYTLNGDRFRTFSTYDGEGFAELKRYNRRVVMVTKSKAKEIYDRASWLEIECYGGIDDKGDFIDRWISREHVEPESLCFIGNDLPDLPAMQRCGFSACPKDAHTRIHNHCIWYGFVSSLNGGKGAFRDIAERMISRKFVLHNY